MHTVSHAELPRSLNGDGRHSEGHFCPWDWFIQPGKPPRVPQVAWTAMAPQVLEQHRTWLQNFKAVPADLLGLLLHTAAVEFVRRMDCARHWKWSTVLRHYAAIQATLLQLPLYTN
jgi:hypothetical protein